MHNSPRSATLQSDWPTYSQGYKLLNMIGKGHFGVVWKAKVTEGQYKGRYVAIKKIDLEKCDSSRLQDIRKNVLRLNLLDHTNILSYKASFINDKELWIVCDLMDGGSFNKILEHHYPNGIKDQTIIATILKEALQGLIYLHQNHQIHRDIKAANILISSDGAVKISDFELSAKLKEGKKKAAFVGSPCWMAPEMLCQDKSGYDQKVDIWSLGITALELAYGKPPGHDMTTMQLIIQTLNGQPPKLKDESCWDEQFQNFVSYCLVKDPTKRKTGEELLKCCKQLFSKARGRSYLKEKLLKDIGSFESRVPLDAKKVESDKKGHLRKASTLEFSFQFQDKKDDGELARLLDHSRVMLSRAHLPRLETDFIMSRTLIWSNSASIADLEPHSADYLKEVVSKKFLRSSHRHKTEKLEACGGDFLTNIVGEEDV